MFERAQAWCIHAGSGHWPDADMLPVGAILQDYGKDCRTKFTHEEQITMLTLWCIMRSPLMIGGDMVYNDEFTLNLLTNSSVLEMLSQSRSAHPLFRREIGGNEIILWHAYRRDGGAYIAVFNAGESQAELTFSLEEINIDTEYVSFTELWTGERSDNAKALSCSVAPHGAAVFFAD